MTAASLRIRAPSGPTEIDQAVDLVRVSLEPGWRFGGGSLRACLIDSLRELLVALAADEWYPGWADHFAAAATENIVVGRDRRGQVVAALIVEPPGQAQRWEQMLGPGCTTIGCVGTLRVVRGGGIGTALVAAATERLRDAGGAMCHIGWTVLLSFYGRL